MRIEKKENLKGRIAMKSFYIKQKIMSMRGRFDVFDETQQEVYKIEGSFMQIPKTFTIFDLQRNEKALITKKTFSFLPTFYVEVEGRQLFTIKKEFTFFKAKYAIEGAGIQVQGNVWSMEFEIIQNGKKIGQVSKEWLTWGDTYHIQVFEEQWEMIVIALVVAIDCVKADQNNTAAASSV